MFIVPWLTFGMLLELRFVVLVFMHGTKTEQWLKQQSAHGASFPGSHPQMQLDERHMKPNFLTHISVLPFCSWSLAGLAKLRPELSVVLAEAGEMEERGGADTGRTDTV